MARMTYLRARQELDLAAKTLRDAGGAHGAPPASVHATVARAEEILDESHRTFRRLAAAVEDRVNRFLLIEDSLRGVDGGGADLSARGRSLLERQALQESSSKLDELLLQAAGAQDELGSQGRVLSGALGGLGDIASRVPFLNATIRWISARRKRDQLIIAATVALCTVLLLWAVLARVAGPSTPNP
jgi:golgi SNAP receptor complex member 1